MRASGAIESRNASRSRRSAAFSSLGVMTILFHLPVFISNATSPDKETAQPANLPLFATQPRTFPKLARS
jgi:hypothetical protein